MLIWFVQVPSGTGYGATNQGHTLFSIGAVFATCITLVLSIPVVLLYWIGLSPIFEPMAAIDDEQMTSLFVYSCKASFWMFLALFWLPPVFYTIDQFFYASWNGTATIMITIVEWVVYVGSLIVYAWFNAELEIWYSQKKKEWGTRYEFAYPETTSIGGIHSFMLIGFANFAWMMIVVMFTWTSAINLYSVCLYMYIILSVMMQLLSSFYAAGILYIKPDFFWLQVFLSYETITYWSHLTLGGLLPLLMLLHALIDSTLQNRIPNIAFSIVTLGMYAFTTVYFIFEDDSIKNWVRTELKYARWFEVVEKELSETGK